MKKILSASALILAGVSPALSWAELEPHPVQKVRDYLDKNRPCLIAYSLVHPLAGAPGINGGKGLPKATVTQEVVCVTDLVIGKGGINEKKGCAVVSYDISTRTFRDPINFVEGKPCLEGGAEPAVILNEAQQTQVMGLTFTLTYVKKEPYYECLAKRLLNDSIDCSKQRPKEISRKLSTQPARK